MEMRENHSGLYYRTRDGESPQGKQKVYFSATERDQDRFFEEICADIFKYRPECAIFYKGKDDPGFTKERQEVLAEMNLFVMPVTTELLTKENPVLSQEYPFVQERRRPKIPVLPLMQEQGLEDVFNYKCGELQFLDKHTQDDTAIPYEEKLRKYLEGILIGDEMAEKIRAAFDAYIFLSYRKKDRKQAQTLMRLIHGNEELESVAIWYDEFLVPGENFNHAIGEALQKSHVFTLLVTPNLVNEPNYVQQEEYPAAVNWRKPVLPVETEETDRAALEEQYPDIPLCTPPEADRLRVEIPSRMIGITLGKNNNDPMHLFLMGLAYLGGIDVERDPERAVKLLTKAAGPGGPGASGGAEACGKLANMYNTGDGVERNYETAALWLQKQAQLLKERWEKEQTEDAGDRYFDCLKDLGGAWQDLAQLEKAWDVYTAMLTLAEYRLQQDAKNDHFRNQYGIVCNRLGDVAQANGRLGEAADWYRRDLEIFRVLAEETGTVEARRNLSVSYDRMGNIARANGKLSAAADWYRRALEICRALAEENETVEARSDLSISYSRMGDISKANGKLDEAADWYSEYLEICRVLAEETGTVEARRNLSISYERMGNIARANGKLDEAADWYRRVLEICRALAEEAGTVEARSDLSISYSRMGAIAQANGRLSEAADWYGKKLEIARVLAEETGTVEARIGLSNSYSGMGDISKANGKLDEAADWYRLYLEIARALAEETGTVETRRSLSISYSRMGAIAQANGKHNEAADWYSQMIEILRALAEETGTVESRRDLSIAYLRMGDVAEANGKLNEAAEWYSKNLEISRALAEETKTVAARRDLSVSYSKMGDVAQTNGKLDEAADWYSRAIELFRILSEETGTAAARKDLAISYVKMGYIMEANGELNSAKEWYLQSSKLLETLVEKTGDSESADILESLRLILKLLPD